MTTDELLNLKTKKKTTFGIECNASTYDMYLFFLNIFDIAC